jgi:hypothetical protein
LQFLAPLDRRYVEVERDHSIPGIAIQDLARVATSAKCPVDVEAAGSPE